MTLFFLATWTLLTLALVAFALAVDALLDMISQAIRRRKIMRRLREVC